MRKSLTIQCLLSGVYILATGVWDEKVMLSAFVGCMACLIPNIYIYIRMAKQSDNNNAGQWLGHAYRSEFGKWIMTGTIFIVAFMSKHSWDPIVLFSGYVLIQVSSMFVPFVIKED